MIPVRSPFVREITHTAGITPAQAAFYLGTQDALGAVARGLFGRRATLASQDFTSSFYGSTTMAGDLAITINQNGAGQMALTASAPTAPGDCGVLQVLSSTTSPFRFEMASALSHLGTADFLFCAKVRLVRKYELSPLLGFSVSIGDNYPQFFAQSVTDNWLLTTFVVDPSTGDVQSEIRDSGIPALEQEWYELAISRTSGILRHFINGRQVSVGQGDIRPFFFNKSSRRVTCERVGNGLVGSGFEIDYFHAWRAR